MGKGEAEKWEGSSRLIHGPAFLLGQSCKWQLPPPVLTLEGNARQVPASCINKPSNGKLQTEKS
ncbi:hypothetical protein CC79DRAFT_1335883 [Sarocladium strictum]